MHFKSEAWAREKAQPCRRAGHEHSLRAVLTRQILRHYAFEVFNLTQVMTRVYPVKLAPLRSRKRPQKRMFHQVNSASKALLAFADRCVHALYLLLNGYENVLRAGTFGESSARRLSPLRHIAEPYDNHLG